jgi:hypothetical protein
MNQLAKAIVLGLAMAAAAAACSSRSQPSSTATGSPGSAAPSQGAGTGTDDGTGVVALQYGLPGGQTINSVHYVLKNASNTYSGDIDVSTATTLGFQIQNVLAGAGYGIALTATTTDGSDTCIGAIGAPNHYADPPDSVVGQTFLVAAASVTQVNVNMICEPLPGSAPPTMGTVAVTAFPSCCAAWQTAAASPAAASTAAPGNTSSLNAFAEGACGKTDAGANPLLNCTWTVTQGTGSVGTTTTDGLGSFRTTFTCPSTGETDTIALGCSDGPLPDGGACSVAMATTTVNVTCSTPEAGTPEAGTEAGADAEAGALAPCKSAADVTAGKCVQCNGNTSGVCSATEAAIVALDIAKGRITSAGAPATTASASCYACLWNNDCIDNDANGDTNKECEDFGSATVPTGGAGAGQSSSTVCANVFACIFTGPGDGCVYNTVDGPSFCYCGAAGGPAASCSASSNPAVNGPCEHLEALGYAFAEFDSKDILSNYNAVAMASGRANQILNCALSNHKHGGCDTLCQ